MPKANKLTDEIIARIHELFEIVGSDVVAKVNYGGSSGNKVKAGEIAGYIKKDGYRYISVLGVKLLAHRVAFVLAFGHDPYPLFIDHIDGNTTNNSADNLRLATNTQNQHNQKAQDGGTSKYKNVRLYKLTDKWQARFKIGGKRISLGLFDTELEAALAYDAFAEAHPCDYWSTNQSLGLLPDIDLSELREKVRLKLQDKLNKLALKETV